MDVSRTVDPRLAARVRAVVALLTRVGLGVVFVAHGWQKLVTDGIPVTAKGFTAMGVPAPSVSAWYAGLIELVGGIALIVGLALPVVGVLLFLDMAGAFVFVHVSHGVFAGQGGFELVLALGLASLYVGFAGGPLALDALVARLRRRTPAPVTA
ncbi:MAG TPA: DoxX family protein [Actinocatenispora sp.]